MSRTPDESVPLAWCIEAFEKKRKVRNETDAMCRLAGYVVRWKQHARPNLSCVVFGCGEQTYKVMEAEATVIKSVIMVRLGHEGSTCFLV